MELQAQQEQLFDAFGSSNFFCPRTGSEMYKSVIDLTNPFSNLKHLSILVTHQTYSSTTVILTELILEGGGEVHLPHYMGTKWPFAFWSPGGAKSGNDTLTSPLISPLRPYIPV